MSNVSLETVVALIALEIVDAQAAEARVGDDCGNDTLAAHVCGKISGLMDLLVKVNNLQDPTRTWAMSLAAAENKAKVQEILRLAVDVSEKRAALKELKDSLDAALGHSSRPDVN